MAWQMLQSASGTSTSAALTLTVTLGSNATAGTKLIAFIGTDNTSATSITSVQDAALNSMTQIGIENAATTERYRSNICHGQPAGDVGIKLDQDNNTVAAYAGIDVQGDSAARHR